MTPITTVTIYVALHPWCHDERRDEAVRAAEDNRPGPLPTLEEAIGMLPKTGSASSGPEHENKGDDMGRIWYPKSEREAPAEPPTTHQASPGMVPGGPWFPQRVKVELPPTPTPEPSVARVTLEFSGRHVSHPSQWPWGLILSGACIVRMEPGESVRVVEDAAEAMAESVAWQVASLESQLESVACRAATAENRVAELEARTSTAGEDSRDAPAASGGGEGEPVAAPPQPRGWLTEEEREFLDHHRHQCKERASTFSNAQAVPWVRRVKLIDDLLARSSPPEVVLPLDMGRRHGNEQYCLGWEDGMQDARSALAAAGVPVKEVW
jgi:hypothetical protein